MVVTAWKDKKQVTMLSSNLESVHVDGDNKPDVVALYNSNMGGVDRHDQLSSYYIVGRSSRKFWRYILSFLINGSIINAYILWKKGNHNPRPKNTYDQEDFRIDLSEAMRAGFTSRKRSAGRPSKAVNVVSSVATA